MTREKKQRQLKELFEHSITKQTTSYTKYCSEVGFLKTAHIACFDPETKNAKNHNITWKYCSVAFQKITQSHNHTRWFDPQSKKLEPHCITKQTQPLQVNSQKLKSKI